MTSNLRRLGSLLALALAAAAPARTLAATLSVPDGFPTIQAAIDAAFGGDEILVKPGRYHERLSIARKSLWIHSTDGAAATIIDGDALGTVVSYSGTPSGALEGFTITNGAGGWGGGIVAYQSSPTVSNCVITGNSAGSGGGVAGYWASWVRLDRTTVTGNYASYAGGGTFGWMGGVNAFNSTISNNTAGSYGGGMAAVSYCGFGSAYQSLVVGNTAGVSGGGLFSGFDRCGGVAITVENSVVSGNSAPRGGGVAQEPSSAGSGSCIRNSTIADNVATEGGGFWAAAGTFYGILNTILWNNGSTPVFALGSNYTLVYGSDVEGGVPPEVAGYGNIAADPLFLDPAGLDYRLRPGSPAVDAGVVESVCSGGPPGADLVGMPRPQGAGYDIGAYEIDLTPPAIAIVAPANGAAYLLGQPVTADWTATDGGSGLASAAGTVPSGALVDTATVGSKTFQVTASDVAGNAATASATYDVRYAFGGVLPPLRADGTGTSKLGSPLPVKFRLLDFAGAVVPTAVARLFVAPLVSGVPGPESAAVASGSGQVGNTFRFDPLTGQYVFTMGTRGMTAGAWQLRIELDDGTSQRAAVTLL